MTIRDTCCSCSLWEIVKLLTKVKCAMKSFFLFAKDQNNATQTEEIKHNDNTHNRFKTIGPDI